MAINEDKYINTMVTENKIEHTNEIEYVNKIYYFNNYFASLYIFLSKE